MKKSTIQNEITRRRSKCLLNSDADKHVTQFLENLKTRGYNQQFLNKVNCPRNTRRQTQQQNSKIFYINLPFIDDKTDRKIQTMFKRKGIHIRLARKSNNLFNFLRPKRETNLQCTSTTCITKHANICFKKNVVYDIKCSGCHDYYFSHCQRFLHTRMQDHQRGNNSLLHPHFQTCNNSQFTASILTTQKDCVDAKLSEGILIKKVKPKLNRREEIQELF